MTELLALDKGVALGMFRTMALIRACDDHIQAQLSSGAMQFQYYPCGGQEAIPAAISDVLTPEDYMVTTYRGVHDIVAKGAPITEVLAEMFGRETGTSKGKGGPMHLSDPNSGLMVTTGIVGAGLPIANGLALAAQIKGSGRVVVCNFGDGASNIGAFGESLNLAALWDLPVVFVCQNNLYAEYTSFAGSTRGKDIASRAESYGMPGVRVDGCDPVAVRAAAHEALGRARRGEGPTLLECVARRLQGHSFGSDEGHMDQAALAEARAAPPIARYRQALIDAQISDAAQLDAIVADAEAEITSASAIARQQPAPGHDELYADIFADASHLPEGGPALTVAEPAPPQGAARSMSMCEAINQALDIALSEDPSVVLLGEDIADPAGGVAKTTAGLSTKFGEDRVRATPIAEEAIVGAAIGASLAGLKPVAELMIFDFALVAMDQIVNHAAKLRYMSGGRTSVPMVIRTLTAGNVGSFGAQHSQSLEAMLLHTPGLKVVMPSNPADAKGLLLSCIDDPDPCVFVESMRIHFSPGPVPEGADRIPLGKAKVMREGSDVSLITYGWTVHEALAAANSLGEQGISAEVVDLRSLVPLDMGTILTSVGKTKRAVIIHAAVEFCGYGAELAARLQQQLFGQLLAPIARVGGRYTPVPFASELEALHFPDADRIVATAAPLVAGR